MKVNILHPSRVRHLGSPDFATPPPGFLPEHTAILRDYGRVHLRPVQPEDEERMRRFHQELSDEGVYPRYFEPFPTEERTVHERLAQMCTNTPETLATIAEIYETASHPWSILALGRLAATEFPYQAAFAMAMGDRARKTKLPRELLYWMMELARAYRFHSLSGELLFGDTDTLKVCREFGFRLHAVPEDRIVRVRYAL